MNAVDGGGAVSKGYSPNAADEPNRSATTSRRTAETEWQADRPALLPSVPPTADAGAVVIQNGSVAPAAKSAPPSLSAGERLLAVVEGLGTGAVKLIKGAATLGKQVAIDLPQHLAQEVQTAADRYATLSATDATRLTLQDVGRDLAKVGEMGAAVLNGVVSDAVNVGVLGYRAVTDAHVTEKEMQQLGESLLNTGLNLVAGAGAVKTVARVNALGKIAYTSEVITKGAARVSVEGAQTTRILVQGAGAAEMAERLAAPVNRPLFQQVADAAGALAEAKGAAQMGAVGEKVAVDVAKALGAEVRVETKLPGNRGIDVAAVSKDGKQAIYIEAKATTNPANIVSGLRQSKVLPAPEVIQGTEQYNKAYVDKMLDSPTRPVRTVGAELRAAAESKHLVTSVNTDGKLRIVSGEALLRATSNSTKVAGSQTSGVVQPAYSAVEKVTVALPPIVATSATYE